MHLVALIFTLTFLSTYSWGQSASANGEDPDIANAIERNLPKIEKGAKDARWKALDDLSAQFYRKQRRGNPLRMQTREQVCKRLRTQFLQSKDDAESAKLRAKFIEVIAMYGGGVPEAQSLIIDTMVQGSPALRRVVLATIGTSEVAVAGDEVYDKILELETRGILPHEDVPFHLSRANRGKALPEILKRVRQVRDRRAFVKAASALLDYDSPQHVSEILRRSEELHLHESPDLEGDSLYWLNRPVFKRFVEAAGDQELKAAMHAVEHGAPVDVSSVVMQRQLYMHSDPYVCRISIQHLRKVAGEHSVPLDHVEAVLKDRLLKEQDASVLSVLRSELDALAIINRHRNIRNK